MTAAAYLREFAGVYEISTASLDRLEAKVGFLDPREQKEEYRLAEVRRQFDSETFGFYQTYLNVPVWRAGLKVTIKQGPNRVIRSENTTQPGVDARMPSTDRVERYRKLFAAANAATLQRRAVRADTDLQSVPMLVPKAGEQEGEREGEGFLRRVFAFDKGSENRRVRVRLIRGRFWIYRYDAEERLQEPGEPARPPAGRQAAERQRPRRKGVRESPGLAAARPFGVPPVHETIKQGAWYMVAETTFEAGVGNDHLVWRALIDVQTDSVLYLRPLAADVNGLVFEEDPITKTGDTTLTAASTDATLNPHRHDVVLENLDAPVAGTQSLRGSFVEVTQVEGPVIAPPTQPTGSDFDYDVRTNDFASVSGYFHVDRIFRVMQDLGFDVSTYMANTVFPIPVDIRCFDFVNAHCVGDGMGGIGHAGYGTMDSSIAGDPLGRACDPRVHLHEVLGHGILYEAVDSPNMGFTHSAGDSLSLIYFDPDSQCRGVDGTPLGKPGDLRFTYVPWHPTLNRRCDRNVVDGWTWNGSRDDSGYGSEEILATTLFRIYRSIGGDHPNLGRRQFASRMTMYLVLRAIGDLTPATDPQYARDFAAALMAADAGNWTSEGVFGGAYHKVIRWAFEKQGEYQTPLVTSGSPADGTVTTAGDPPDVDVYIDDGRGGEYQFQHVHWATTAIWNRRSPDGVFAHQEPEIGATNHAYVKVKNRGTQQAQNVTVYGYHTKPGAGLNWPADFESFDTASISVGTINGNNTQEVTVGPFEWTPNVNGYGHDCMLMVVKADGDPANVDNFTAGETIPEWRLVPNDNNIAQRNVVPVAGGCGERGLMASLDGVSFFVGNPNPKRGRMTFNVHLPALLTDRGWRLELVGVDKGFTLASGAKREVFLRLHPGASFTRDAVEAAADRDIRIEVLANDNTVGGMTYRIDPDLKMPWNKRPKDRKCRSEAQRLAECLGIRHPVKKVCVKEVVVSLKMDCDDGCDDDCC
ncbi:MAG TPA: hypothetical protein VIL35_10060 [Vicinamibacterales bacterium]